MINALLVLLAVLRSSQELTLWQLTDTVSIYFHVDGVSKLFALFISCMWLCVGVLFVRLYDRARATKAASILFYLISLGVLIGLSFSGQSGHDVYCAMS